MYSSMYLCEWIVPRTDYDGCLGVPVSRWRTRASFGQHHTIDNKSLSDRGKYLDRYLFIFIIPVRRSLPSRLHLPLCSTSHMRRTSADPARTPQFDFHTAILALADGPKVANQRLYSTASKASRGHESVRLSTMAHR